MQAWGATNVAKMGAYFQKWANVPETNPFYIPHSSCVVCGLDVTINTGLEFISEIYVQPDMVDVG